MSVFCNYTHTKSVVYVRACIHTHTRVPGATPEKLLYSIALTLKIYNDRGFSLARRCLSFGRTHTEFLRTDTTQQPFRWVADMRLSDVPTWWSYGTSKTRTLIGVRFALSMLVSSAGGCDKNDESAQSD